MQIHRIFFSLALPLLVLGDIIPKNPLTGVTSSKRTLTKHRLVRREVQPSDCTGQDGTGDDMTGNFCHTNSIPDCCGFTCQAGSEACYKIGICSDGGNTGKVNWKSTDLDAQKYPCSKGCQSTCFGTTPADALTGGGSMSGGEFGIEDADG